MAKFEKFGYTVDSIENNGEIIVTVKFAADNVVKGSNCVTRTTMEGVHVIAKVATLDDDFNPVVSEVDIYDKSEEAAVKQLSKQGKVKVIAVEKVAAETRGVPVELFALLSSIATRPESQR